MNHTIKHIIYQLEEINQGKPWMGASFSTKLKMLEEDDFFKRPQQELHSVAEIIHHIIFWREEAVEKIKTGKGTKTDDAEENWLGNDRLMDLGWENIKSSFDQSLADIIKLLEEKNDEFLKEKYYDLDFKGYYTFDWMLNGLIQHDAYHLGQIGIIIKLLLSR